MKKSFVWVMGAALAAGTLLPLAAAGPKPQEPASAKKKVIVLGMDGLDPRLLRRYMSEGKLPNFSALAAQGSFRELATTNPPQSPVAWSTIMTGLDPGGHGIFDFIHRDPATLLPFLSTTADEESDAVLTPGSQPYPLAAGHVRQLRDGRAFWEYLDEAGIPATIFRMPSNWPPVAGAARTFSGMGTPDLLGTYGTFSFYTDDLLYTPGPVDGGRVHAVEAADDVAHAKLYGPYNPYVKGRPQVAVDFAVRIDRETPGVTITLPGQQVKLREGQWSDWVALDFDLAPGPAARGICRFYLKQAHPRLELYVSPINIDPAAPALPLSTPREYAPELAARAGRFHSLGIAEDTKALSAGIFSDAEYLAQARTVLAEQRRLFDLEFAKFSEGLFFFYFSSADQNAHMVWRLTDPQHPAYDAQLARVHGAALESFYKELDAVLGQAVKRLDPHTTLIVLSDHGFAPFYRQFNLNTWLAENGYLVRKQSAAAGGAMLEGVDWSRTRAYGLGLNALYLNRRGRERDGIVTPEETDALKKEIAAKLLAYRDPQTGAPAVTRVADAAEIYHGPHAAEAPDLLVGYGWGYRIGWGSVLGGIPAQVVEDNLELWSGDHAMDPALVPGVLLSNRKIAAVSPSLLDIAPTLLTEFGIAVPDAMRGHPIFSTPQQKSQSAQLAKPKKFEPADTSIVPRTLVESAEWCLGVVDDCLGEFLAGAEVWTGDIDDDRQDEVVVSWGIWAGSGGNWYQLYKVAPGQQWAAVSHKAFNGDEAGWQTLFPRFDILPIVRHGYHDLRVALDRCLKWDGLQYVDYEPQDYKKLSPEWFDSADWREAEIFWAIRYAGEKRFRLEPQWLPFPGKLTDLLVEAKRSDPTFGLEWIAIFKSGVWGLRQGRGFLVVPRPDYLGAGKFAFDGDWLLIYGAPTDEPLVRYNRRTNELEYLGRDAP